MYAVLAVVGPWLCVGVCLGIPFALAWWLSEGFAGISSWPSAPWQFRNVFNPRTGRHSAAWVDESTGQTVMYTE